jgi:hypothetical protein
MMLAALRADSVNFPLLLHVLGAMLLVGVLAAALAAVLLARSEGAAGLQRVAFRALLIGGIPSFLLMRIGAEWVASEQDVSDEAAWIGIGYGVSDFGLLLLIVVTVLAGLASRRANRGEQARGLGTASTAIISLMLLGYGIAIWAMTSKPV